MENNVLCKKKKNHKEKMMGKRKQGSKPDAYFYKSRRKGNKLLGETQLSVSYSPIPIGSAVREQIRENK